MGFNVLSDTTANYMLQYLACDYSQWNWAVVGGTGFISFLEDWYNKGFFPIWWYCALINGCLEKCCEGFSQVWCKLFESLVGISSGPAALCMFKLLTNFGTPFSVIWILSMRGCVLCPLSRMVLISSLLLKTGENWQFKILAFFSLSEYVRPSVSWLVIQRWTLYFIKRLMSLQLNHTCTWFSTYYKELKTQIYM